MAERTDRTMEVFGDCSNPGRDGHSFEPDVTVEVVAVWNRIADALPEGVRLAKVVLHETP